MLPIPLERWLELYDHRSHPAEGFHSALTSRQLWRLHAVQRGHVPGLHIDATDPWTWGSADVAAFVGASPVELAGHMYARMTSDPTTPMAVADAPAAAQELYQQLEREWRAVRSRPDRIG